MAKSVASADLGELYTPQGPLLGHQLLREINNMANPRSLSLEKLAAFQKNQVELLERYRFPLPQAERTLTRHKPQVIAHSIDIMNKIETGEVESWEAIIEFDQAFARQYR